MPFYRGDTSPARPRAVMVALWLGFCGAALSVLLVVGFILMMRHRGLALAESWYIWKFMPLKLLLTGITWLQLVHIRRDIRAGAAGIPTHYGVPHHGVLLVFSIQGLLYFPIFWLQTAWMIEVNLEGELILFGIANLLGMAAGILGLQIIRWMERPVASACG